MSTNSFTTPKVYMTLTNFTPDELMEITSLSGTVQGKLADGIAETVEFNEKRIAQLDARITEENAAYLFERNRCIEIEDKYAAMRQRAEKAEVELEGAKEIIDCQASVIARIMTTDDAATIHAAEQQATERERKRCVAIVRQWKFDVLAREIEGADPLTEEVMLERTQAEMDEIEAEEAE